MNPKTYQLEVTVLVALGVLRFVWGDAPKCNTPLPTNCGCDTDQGTIDLSPIDLGGSPPA